MHGKTIWITGLSGAGKTTLAKAVIDRFGAEITPILIDGDQIRHLFGADIGFDESARRVQIGRIQRLAKWLADQGHTVVVAALYSHPEILAWNRTSLPGYFEVLLDLPLSIVTARDAKGLYAAARAGRMKNVVGIDIAWHKPEHPDLVFDEGSVEDPEAMAKKLITALTRSAPSRLPDSIDKRRQMA